MADQLEIRARRALQVLEEPEEILARTASTFLAALGR